MKVVASSRNLMKSSYNILIRNVNKSILVILYVYGEDYRNATIEVTLSVEGLVLVNFKTQVST